MGYPDSGGLIGLLGRSLGRNGLWGYPDLGGLIGLLGRSLGRRGLS